MILPAAATHVRANPPSTLDEVTLRNLRDELDDWTGEHDRIRAGLAEAARAIWDEQVLDLKREVERATDCVAGALAILVAAKGLPYQLSYDLKRLLERAEAGYDGVWAGEVFGPKFGFLALGRTEAEARTALDAGLAAHAKQYSGTDPEWVGEVRADFDPQLLRPGCYRDGEPLALLRDPPPETT